jgi:hypothetical protein
MAYRISVFLGLDVEEEKKKRRRKNYHNVIYIQVISGLLTLYCSDLNARSLFILSSFTLP